MNIASGNSVDIADLQYRVIARAQRRDALEIDVKAGDRHGLSEFNCKR